jgi:Zn-dependent protease
MALPALSWYLPILQGMVVGLAAMVFHEAAHIVIALALGIRVKKVGLAWKGVYTVREPGPPDRNLLISVAGPLMNLALAQLSGWLPTFGLANLIFGVVNLLPIPGSDGVRILRCWREMRADDPLDR